MRRPALDQKGILETYCILMEEANIRFRVINYTFRNEASLPPRVVSEICWLQLRFLCEIVALACLVAHGDVQGAEPTSGTWNPQKIMNKLERLNRHYYPQPLKTELIDGKHVMRAVNDGVHLRKGELPILWTKTGAMLHRAPIETAFARSVFDTEVDHSEMVQWTDKLVGLLSSHWITIVENKKGMRVSLKSLETGRAAATIHDYASAAPGTVNLTSMFIDG